MKFIVNFTKHFMKHFTKKIKTYHDPPMLGRWRVKNCDDKMTNINSVYQNRDHCGDNVCKTPVKADKYTN